MPSRQEMEMMFGRLGIDYGNPGFYEASEFQAIEREHPEFLKSYADYIQVLQLTPDYLDRARRTVHETVEFLFNELLADGRKGACVDISGLTLRFLERQGIWCHVVFGGVKVEFPDASGIKARYFYPLMHKDNNARTGHAWIYAPPFKIVDLSISLQPYPEDEQQYFHGYTLTENWNDVVNPIGPLDIMEGELVEDHVRRFRRMPTMNDIAPEQRQFFREYPPHSLMKDGLKFTYIPMNFSAPDLPLEEMLYPTLSGRRPIQVFEEFQTLHH